MPLLIIVIHSHLIAHHGLQLEVGFNNQCIFALQSFFLLSLRSVFLIFDNLHCTGAVMNASNSFARQQACLSPCPMPEVKSFYFQAFPHQFRMSSVSYSSLFFSKYDVQDAEWYFRDSLLKEGFSWRTDLIHPLS